MYPFFNNAVYGHQLFHDKSRVEDDIFEIYAYLKKMGTDLYPVFCVVLVLNVLAQVENVLVQVVNYFWHLIPRFHRTSITHTQNQSTNQRKAK